MKTQQKHHLSTVIFTAGVGKRWPMAYIVDRSEQAFSISLYGPRFSRIMITYLLINTDKIT